MSFDSDVALLGTGVAPLVAANHLLSHGKTVLLLNPDWDFFLEDSELSLDPMLPTHALTVEKIVENSPERASETLAPHFPGAVELWTGKKEGFHDPEAPHIRERGRIWLADPFEERAPWQWSAMEDLYVQAADAGLNPQVLDGLQATRKFPGLVSRKGSYRGLHVPKSFDVDAVRFRNGLLEFIRERLGQRRIVSPAAQVELIPEGIRFYVNGEPGTSRLKDGLVVFWTPRLSAWILNQARRLDSELPQLGGIRLWEKWSLVSREPLDPRFIGVFEEMAVWADFEGRPETEGQTQSTLAALKLGPLMEVDAMSLPQAGLSWASADSFGALSRLCYGLLKWNRISVRSMRPRAIFEWEDTSPFFLMNGCPWVQVVRGCDGPLLKIVRTVGEFQWPS